MNAMLRTTATAVLALILVGAGPVFAQTPAEGAAAAERGNGTMGEFTAAGGDAVLGAQL